MLRSSKAGFELFILNRFHQEKVQSGKFLLGDIPLYLRLILTGENISLFYYFQRAFQHLTFFMHVRTSNFSGNQNAIMNYNTVNYYILDIPALVGLYIHIEKGIKNLLLH